MTTLLRLSVHAHWWQAGDNTAAPLPLSLLLLCLYHPSPWFPASSPENKLQPAPPASSNLTHMCAQLEAVRDGFYQVMPKDVLCKFTELELELLLHGMPVIDVEVFGHVCATRASACVRWPGWC